jgi:hypothetical protein
MAETNLKSHQLHSETAATQVAPGPGQITEQMRSRVPNNFHIPDLLFGGGDLELEALNQIGV